MGAAPSTSYAPRLVQDTLRRIQGLAAEVAQLSRADLAPEDFYRESLNRVVEALGAVGGAVWCRTDQGPLALQYQVNFQKTGLHGDPEAEAQHGQLLAQVLSENRPLLTPPHSGGGDGDAVNPTGFLLMLGPFGSGAAPAGVLEVVQRPDQAPGVQQSQHRFLLQMIEYAGDFVRNHERKSFAERHVLWSRLEEFTRSVHATLDPSRTAYVVANEGRRLIECDRVSVAVCRGRRCVIRSISGQDQVDRRSNTVRVLEKLAGAVVRNGAPLWFTGDTGDMAPQLEQAVGAYVDQTHSKAVGVVPLVPSGLAVGDGEESPQRGDCPAPIGALIVERIEDSRMTPEMVQRTEAVGRHGAVALGNALEHDNLFLLPLWRALGQAGWVVRARTLPKTLAVVVALAALVAWLALWPADLELQARGSLQPVLRRDVFAGIDGRIDEVHVKHRDRVEGSDSKTGSPGTLLVVLTNNDLEEEIARISGERSTTRQRIASIQRSLLEERLIVQEQNRLSAELAQLRQKLRNLDAQWELLRQKQRELTIHSPTSGQVVTWDVRNLLIHRPVRRGQQLMRIARTDGPWQLELEVPEDRIGHILEARKQLNGKPGENAGEGLRVSFILATDPGVEYEGTIEEIHQSAEVRGREGNTVLVKVRIDRSELPHLMPGAGVIAMIDCGRCSVGYDLLHDLLAWGRRMAFRL